MALIKVHRNLANLAIFISIVCRFLDILNFYINLSLYILKKVKNMKLE